MAEEHESLDRRSTQAMVATFMQMARSAELARQLQKMRARTLERRLQQVNDPGEVGRLQRLLEAQQNQAAVLESAVERFQARAADLAEYARQGLNEEELRAMGLAFPARAGDDNGGGNTGTPDER